MRVYVSVRVFVSLPGLPPPPPAPLLSSQRFPQDRISQAVQAQFLKDQVMASVSKKAQYYNNMQLKDGAEGSLPFNCSLVLLLSSLTPICFPSFLPIIPHLSLLVSSSPISHPLPFLSSFPPVPLFPPSLSPSPIAVEFAFTDEEGLPTVDIVGDFTTTVRVLSLDTEELIRLRDAFRRIKVRISACVRLFSPSLLLSFSPLSPRPRFSPRLSLFAGHDRHPEAAACAVCREAAALPVVLLPLHRQWSCRYGVFHVRMTIHSATPTHAHTNTHTRTQRLGTRELSRRPPR